MITPKLVRFFYALSMVVLAVVTLVTIVAAFEVNETTGLIVFVLAPLSALLYLITIRLWLELIVVAFRSGTGSRGWRRTLRGRHNNELEAWHLVVGVQVVG